MEPGGMEPGGCADHGVGGGMLRVVVVGGVGGAVGGGGSHPAELGDDAPVSRRAQ
jgi:hypothetical protein